MTGRPLLPPCRHSSVCTASHADISGSTCPVAHDVFRCHAPVETHLTTVAVVIISSNQCCGTLDGGRHGSCSGELKMKRLCTCGSGSGSTSVDMRCLTSEFVLQRCST